MHELQDAQLGCRLDGATASHWPDLWRYPGWWTVLGTPALQSFSAKSSIMMTLRRNSRSRESGKENWEPKLQFTVKMCHTTPHACYAPEVNDYTNHQGKVLYTVHFEGKLFFFF